LGSSVRRRRRRARPQSVAGSPSARPAPLAASGYTSTSKPTSAGSTWTPAASDRPTPDSSRCSSKRLCQRWPAEPRLRPARPALAAVSCCPRTYQPLFVSTGSGIGACAWQHARKATEAVADEDGTIPERFREILQRIVQRNVAGDYEGLARDLSPHADHPLPQSVVAGVAVVAGGRWVIRATGRASGRTDRVASSAGW
jgi:hypothetical protein